MKHSFPVTLSLAFSLVLWISTLTLPAPHPGEGLKEGDSVPPFTAIDQNGNLWKSSDVVGKKNLVIYFYPAAMTGGCTKQACAFRDDAKKLADADAVVVGVSGDAPAGLKVFQKSHDLNFTLLADYDGKLARLFGVPTRDGGSIQREFQGKDVTLERGVTAQRWTFVIGKDGKIIHRNTKVNAAEDSASVLQALKP